MASVVTFSRESYPLGVGDPRPYLEIISAFWTAHTDGTVASVVVPGKVYGVLQRLVTDPGSPAPQALYDITMTDEDGFDVLGGLGANRSATVTEEAEITMTNFQRIVANTLTFNLSGNNVDGAKGVARIYLLR